MKTIDTLDLSIKQEAKREVKQEMKVLHTEHPFL